MFEFLLILFGFTAAGPDDIAWDPIVCDDGSAPWHGGLPNWDCELYECTPLDSLCWPDRLAGCYDSNGGENGACTIQTSTCKSRLSCFNLWVHCGGTYQCHENDSWIGCTDGSCRSAVSPHPRPLAHADELGPPPSDPGEAVALADSGAEVSAPEIPAPPAAVPRHRADDARVVLRTRGDDRR